MLTPCGIKYCPDLIMLKGVLSIKFDLIKTECKENEP